MGKVSAVAILTGGSTVQIKIHLIYLNNLKKMLLQGHCSRLIDSCSIFSFLRVVICIPYLGAITNDFGPEQ